VDIKGWERRRNTPKQLANYAVPIQMFCGNNHGNEHQNIFASRALIAEKNRSPNIANKRSLAIQLNKAFPYFQIFPQIQIIKGSR
jgi:hypothetical protein